MNKITLLSMALLNKVKTMNSPTPRKDLDTIQKELEEDFKNLKPINSDYISPKQPNGYGGTRYPSPYGTYLRSPSYLAAASYHIFFP